VTRRVLDPGAAQNSSSDTKIDFNSEGMSSGLASESKVKMKIEKPCVRWHHVDKAAMKSLPPISPSRVSIWAQAAAKSLFIRLINVALAIAGFRLSRKCSLADANCATDVLEHGAIG
jgi:hypothetical protein